MSILLYMLVTPSLFYLGSRAMITSWLWSRYPPAFAGFMDCAACTGFWYGAGLAALGAYLELPFLGLAGADLTTIVLVALCSMTWTPIIAALVQKSFEALGSAP